jgi:hypothetical protein
MIHSDRTPLRAGIAAGHGVILVSSNLENVLTIQLNDNPTSGPAHAAVGFLLDYGHGSSSASVRDAALHGGGSERSMMVDVRANQQ